MNNAKFLMTFDGAVAKLLRANGFLCLGTEGNKHLFLNSGSMQFSEDIKKKVVFTNIMTI